MSKNNKRFKFRIRIKTGNQEFKTFFTTAKDHKSAAKKVKTHGRILSVTKTSRQ